MSHFYAEIQGNRGLASRQGTEQSGIWGHIRGWDVGITVVGFINAKGEDEFRVSLTHGSNGFSSSKLIGSFTKDDFDKGVLL